jgi:hypothetical protein
MTTYATCEDAASLSLLPRFPAALDKSPLTRRGYLDATINPIGECLWPTNGCLFIDLNGRDAHAHPSHRS